METVAPTASPEGGGHVVVLDPRQREALLLQRTERMLAAFRVLGGLVGLALTLLARADHPPVQFTLEVASMGAYAVVGATAFVLLGRARDLDQLERWGRRLLAVDAAVLLAQPPLHAYATAPQGPSPALVVPFLAGLRASFPLAWAAVGGVAVALGVQELLATRLHHLPSGYDPGVVTLALATVLGGVSAHLARTAARGRRMADAATAETQALHRVLRAGVGGGVDAAAPRMAAELEALLGPGRVRLELGEEAVPAMPLEVVLPVASGGRTFGHLRLSGDPDEVEVEAITRLADQVALALQGAAVLDREVDLARRFRDLHRLEADFVAIASHELRTPVTAIVGAAEVLAERRADLDPADRDQLLDALHRQGRRLQRLMDDLLVVGRHDAGTLLIEPTTVHVPAVVAEVVAQLRLDGVVLEGEDDTWARADPDRLAQVLSNVLDNAREHGAGPIHVGWSAGEQVRLKVLDHGPGIDPSDRERVFERFVQGGRADSHSHGSGLGLAIARDLARAMDGELWATDRPDRTPGACVVIQLCRARRPVPA